MTDVYGLGNSLSNSSSSLNNASLTGGFLNGTNSTNGGNGGCGNLANGNVYGGGNGGSGNCGSGGGVTPQINTNSPSIPYSPLTPSSLSSSTFVTPAKNFDALQVCAIFINACFSLIKANI